MAGLVSKVEHTSGLDCSCVDGFDGNGVSRQESPRVLWVGELVPRVDCGTPVIDIGMAGNCIDPWYEVGNHLYRHWCNSLSFISDGLEIKHNLIPHRNGTRII